MVILNKKLSAERISKAIDEVGMNSNEVADKLGVTPGAVSHWRTGMSSPNVANFLALADLTGYPVEYFVPAIRGVPAK